MNIDGATNLILESAEDHNPVVAFSGGKDSTLVLHLVRELLPNTPAVFCNTMVEAPETVKYCRSIENLIELRPTKTFWECVKEYGWPSMKGKGTTRVNACCEWLKDKPMRKWLKANPEYDLIFTGLTMAESRQRMMFIKAHGSSHWVKSWNVFKCHPIWDWTEKEVWAHIKEYNIVYNPIYDSPRNAVRCGCQPCTAYLSWKKRLARENPRLMRAIIQMQGQSTFEQFMKDTDQQGSVRCTG